MKKAVKESKCDMRGFLSFMILWLLSRKAMHGQQLAEEIAKRKGEKPKAGTLYPALKQLKEMGLIIGEKKGTVITYKLTKIGKIEAGRTMDYFLKCFGEIVKR